MPDTIRIRATDERSALALVASLDGLPGEAISQDGTHEVLVRPDSETASLLVELFQAVGTWLSEGGHASCEIRFGDRSVTMVAPSDGQPSDATQFLLERTIQLQTALESRVAIEQAKGMLAERLGVTPEEAFKLLRSAARSSKVKLQVLALEVVRSPETPAAIARLAEELRG
jgi:ANTAR domain